MRAVVNDTSGNDTFEGAPGAENKKQYYLQIYNIKIKFTPLYIIYDYRKAAN
jgi:hypothetical protein